MEDKKEPIKIRLSTVILVFIIFILIVTIISILIYYNGDKEENNYNTSSINSMIDDNNLLNESTENVTNTSVVNENTQTIEELDINSELVNKLYSYILKDNECVETIAYQNQKVTISNLDNKAKLMTIFTNMDDSEADRTKTEKNYGEEETTYYFSKEKVEEKAKQLFGDQVSITHESLTDLLAKEIVYENGEYIKTYIQGGGGFLWEDSTEKLIKAEKSSNEIYLYDKYIHVVRDEDNYSINNVYDASDKKTILASGLSLSSINIDTINNVKTFKHTFKKNSDGSYYWYSTEPIV